MGVHRGGHCADESRGNGARTSLRLFGVSPLRSCVLGLRSLVARRSSHGGERCAGMDRDGRRRRKLNEMDRNERSGQKGTKMDKNERNGQK